MAMSRNHIFCLPMGVVLFLAFLLGQHLAGELGLGHLEQEQLALGENLGELLEVLAYEQRMKNNEEEHRQERRPQLFTFYTEQSEISHLRNGL